MCGRIGKRIWQLIDNLGNESKLLVLKLMSEKSGKSSFAIENVMVFGLFLAIMIQ